MKHSIPNFYSYSLLLASGAQPTELDLHALQEEGYEVVINISPSSAKNALSHEALLVENLKMGYMHFPIDCSNLRPFYYNCFSHIMQSVIHKKVFVHCGGNIKSSNLIHMFHVLECNIPLEESYNTLLQIQNPEPKWLHYFKEMGMKGIEV